MNRDDILRILPPVLKKDDGFAALGKIIAEQLAKNRELTDKALIYPAIDKLDEPVLDALAYDLNVPWYDYEGGLESKRSTIRECLQIHQYKGTKYAVRAALEGVYENVRVREWFEYGGEPYHFKVTIYDSGGDAEKRGRVLAKIKYYKNLRSVLDETEFIIGIKAEMPVYAGFGICGKTKRLRCVINERRIIGVGADIALHSGVKICGKTKRIFTEVSNGDME